MNKATLKRLGGLCEAIDNVWNIWVANKHSDEDTESTNKLKLLRKVKKQLEEQKRGFVGNKVNYSAMADYLIENYETRTFEELQEGILNILKG